MIINKLCKPQFQLIYKNFGRLKSSKPIFEARARRRDLNRAVTEAEKIVGYPTSFLNLRWLLTDELANVAFHLRKLIGTDHPLIHTARKVFMGNSMPAWGLIVLLISKAYGLNSEFPDNEKDATAGVLTSQRALAEVTEMIRTSNIIHKSVFNLHDKIKDDEDLNFGNKITLLSGDYLLSKSYHQLACLKNQDLNELMSSALRDVVDSEFFGLRDEQDMPIPSKPVGEIKAIKIIDQFGTEPYLVEEVLGHPIAEWTLRNILGGASLLGKSCQGVLKLAHHPMEIQQMGYIFGKSMALAWQAKCEQEVFTRSSSGTFSLVAAPVMFHLQSNPSCYDDIFVKKDKVYCVDYDHLREVVKNGSALEKTQQLKNEYLFNALEVLKTLSTASDARTALENIIHSTM